ncbi:MAG: nucleoside phosphorylase [Isosphaeraceae bacterium]
MASGGPTPVALALPPAPADIGLVAALPIEVGPLLERFTRVRTYTAGRLKVFEGRCGGRVVAAVIAGPGRKAARRGAELLLAGHRPAWVLSVGFGGALNPSLGRNDIVFATEVVDLDGLRLAIDLAPPIDESPGRRITSGRVLTVDAIVRTALEKAELHQRFGADVVDMETSSVANVCATRGIRFLSIRVVSDEAQTDLPAEVLSILGSTGSYRLGAALGAIWRRPSSLKDLWTLRDHAVSAADRLAEVVPGVFAQLP